jgi:hypothetical protein
MLMITKAKTKIAKQRMVCLVLTKVTELVII